MQYESIAQIVEDLESNPAEKGGNVYHRIPFPEFDHLKTSSDQKAVDAKWKTIKATCQKLFGKSLQGRRVLDVGANGGFYTFSLAKLGVEVDAFELHPRYAPIGDFLAMNKQLPVTWHPTGYSPELVEDKTYDACLLLSVFQWMCEGDSSDKKALAELRHMSQCSKYMFFELGLNHGLSCVTTSKRNHYAYLVDFLDKHTDYQFFRLLAKTKLWRSYSRFLILCSNDANQDDSWFRKLVRSIGV